MLTISAGLRGRANVLSFSSAASAVELRIMGRGTELWAEVSLETKGSSAIAPEGGCSLAVEQCSHFLEHAPLENLGLLLPWLGT